MKKLFILLVIFMNSVFAETLVDINALPQHTKLQNTKFNPISSEDGIGETNKSQTSESGSGRIIGYLPGWKTPPEPSGLSKAGYTHIIIAFGVFSTTAPGEVVGVFDTISPDYIKSLQENDIKVLLSIGGASSSIPDTTINFHQAVSDATSPEAFTQTFVNSISTLIEKYGFEGVDFDIESGLNGGGSFAKPIGDIATLADIINTLHSKNPELLLTLAPQTPNVAATSGFDATWGNYASLVMQTYQALSWVGIQLYNSGCAFGIDLICYDPNNTKSPDASVAISTDLLENWPAQESTGQATGFQPYLSYLKPSQVVLGYPAANAEGVSDGSPAAVISNIKRAIQCLRTASAGDLSCDTYIPPRTYPDIGGVFEWEVTYDENNNYKFATELRDCVVRGQCTE
jgi:chitinase